MSGPTDRPWVVIASRSPLPGLLWWWLAVAAVSQLGGGVLRLALSWTATGISAGFAGMISGLTLLPSAVLLLVGGVLGDRWGQRTIPVYWAG